MTDVHKYPQRYEEAVPLNEMHDWPKNPKDHLDDVLDTSIDVFGFVGAVLIQESSGRVIGGHGRRDAARRAGAETAPAIVLDVDDETAAKLVVMLNKSGEGGWVPDLLIDFLTDLPDLTDTGFTDDEFQALAAELAADDQDFFPVGDGENPRLDELDPLVCPNCGASVPRPGT